MGSDDDTDDPDKRPDLIPRRADSSTSRTTSLPPVTPLRPRAATPADVPGEPHGTLYAIPNPPAISQHYVGPPPRGYRYTMAGRVVPVLEKPEKILETEEGQQVFCAVVEVTGSFRAACDCCGIANVHKVKTILEKDPDFAEEVEASADRHRDRLYQAAVTRAADGWDVPIIGGRNKDTIVGYERRFSDGLMALLLKRHFPEFRENPKTVVNVDSRKLTVNQGTPGTSQTLRERVRSLPRDKRDALRKLLAQDVPTEVDPDGVKDG